MTVNIERDWVTSAGLRAVVVVHPAGHRCGYVGVPSGHKNHGDDYDNVDVDVHGGLTYAGGNKGQYPVEDDDLWWFGYDCAHLGDARDPELMDGEYKEIFGRGLLREMAFEGDIVRTLEYCVNECESLAKQLAVAQPAPAPETVMSEYIAGFDAGYDYVLREIERWQEEVGQDLHVLLEHLRMESTKGRETT